MSNIAVVIGVSQYQRQSLLPACKNDAFQIAQLLRASERYGEILSITSETHATSIKDRVAEFVARFQGTEIDEILFYFTGHGLFDGQEYYYVCTDYDERKRRTTTLENSELDNMLRSLKPKLAVKLVDACYSGTPYIKDAEDMLGKYLDAGKEGFKDCYFMYSSHANEPSWQDSALSHFTRALLEAVRDHAGSRVRYKDLIAAVSDRFEASSRQRPYFVTQASFTETFVELTEPVLAVVSEALGSRSQPDDGGDALPAAPSPSLIELVVGDSGRYASLEEAVRVLEELGSESPHPPANSPLSGLFDFDLQLHESLDYVPSVSSIAAWLIEQGDDYFTKVSFRHRDTSTPFDSSALVQAWRALVPPDLIPARFENTVDLPFEWAELLAVPRYPNLQRFECHVVPVVSKTGLSLFYAFAQSSEPNWGVYKRAGSLKWSTKAAPWKGAEGPREVLQGIYKDYWVHIERVLDRSLRPSQTEESQARAPENAGSAESPAD